MDDEEKISCFLNQCVQKEMSNIPLEQFPGYDHNYSKRFQNKMRILFWSEKHFHQNIRLGYALRKIAMVTVCVLSLAVATTVSAKILGVDPWKYTVSFVKEGKMNVKEYQGKHQEKVTSELPDLIQKIPKYLPQKYVQEEITEDQDDLFVIWDCDGKPIFQYSRMTIQDNSIIYTDGEYDSTEKVLVKGYNAQYCKKGRETWLEWDDKKYSCLLDSNDENITKNQMIKIAESLYE